MPKSRILLPLGLASLLAVTGCSNMNHTQKGAALGAAGGAGLGAVIGHQFGATGAGALIGGLGGTAVGALAGNSKDESEKRDRQAQQAAYQAQSRVREQRAITNRDVCDMVQEGVSDNLIINSIQTRGSRFDTSPSAIIALQQRGVSNAVISVMQNQEPRY